MTVRAIVDQAIGLVVTPNFVEAEDICDALRRFGLGKVIHCRSATLALDAISGDKVAPAVVLMSFHEPDEDAERLSHVLQNTGARQVLINGDAAHAQDINAIFLQRPFTDQDLDHCIAQVLAQV